MDNVGIKTGCKTDHRGVTLHIIVNNNPPGKGYCKCNSSLFHDKEYVHQVQSSVKDAITSYAVPIYELGNIHQTYESDIQFVMDDGLLLETLLMNVRGNTIYGSWKRETEGRRGNIRIPNK